MSKNYKYSREFYRQQRDNNLSSAEAVVPYVLALIAPVLREKSVIDMGGGGGNWLSVFAKHGCEITCVDCGTPESNSSVVPSDCFITHDLTKPFHANRQYGLAVSLEVAEHLLPEYSDTFISSLTGLSDIVLFSAAIPFQRGAHHVNEQWPTYWIEKFRKKGFLEIDCLRRHFWNNPDVRGFYAQNMFLFVKDTEPNKPLLELRKENHPEIYHVVHPAVWCELNGYGFMRAIDKIKDIPVIYAIWERIKRKTR